MTEKDAEALRVREFPDTFPNKANQITRARSPVEIAIDAEAATSPSSSTQEKAADVPEPPPNGGLLAWLQVLG